MKLRNAAIVAKPHVTEVTSVVRALLEWLAERGVATAVEERVAAETVGQHISFPLEKPPRDMDLMIVLGGDGTLLSVARGMGVRQTPILGVNLGSLGFLTDVALSELYPSLEAILAGDFELENRVMLRAELWRKGQRLAKELVLNDVVITKGAIARMIEVGVEMDDQFVALVRSDGIIVSTPTGSTAYSLAAGGPILYPGLESMILTPICPHTLTYRPVVVPDRSLITLTLRSDSGEVFATFDGQSSTSLRQGDLLKVKKSRNAVKLIRFEETNYFKVLRHKLRWAERPRHRRRSKKSHQ